MKSDEADETSKSIERVKIEQEHIALHQMLNVCRAGRGFYRYGKRYANNSRLKQTYSSLEAMHSAIISDLETHLATQSRAAALKKFKSDKFVAAIRAAYLMAKKNHSDDETEELSNVEVAESKAVKRLRDLLRRISTRKIRYDIAHNLATMQMNCDVIRSIRQSVKIARNNHKGHSTAH